jgi:hypothetical protein
LKNTQIFSGIVFVEYKQKYCHHARHILVSAPTAMTKFGVKEEDA